MTEEFKRDGQTKAEALLRVWPKERLHKIVKFMRSLKDRPFDNLQNDKLLSPSLLISHTLLSPFPLPVSPGLEL